MDGSRRKLEGIVARDPIAVALAPFDGFNAQVCLGGQLVKGGSCREQVVDLGDGIRQNAAGLVASVFGLQHVSDVFKWNFCGGQYGVHAIDRGAEVSVNGTNQAGLIRGE